MRAGGKWERASLRWIGGSVSERFCSGTKGSDIGDLMKREDGKEIEQEFTAQIPWPMLLRAMCNGKTCL
jgi:hypothetical protein